MWCVCVFVCERVGVDLKMTRRSGIGRWLMRWGHVSSAYQYAATFDTSTAFHSSTTGLTIFSIGSQSFHIIQSRAPYGFKLQVTHLAQWIIADRTALSSAIDRHDRSQSRQGTLGRHPHGNSYHYQLPLAILEVY